MITKMYDSPVGRLLIGAAEGRLVLCDWVMGGQPRTAVVKRIERFLGKSFGENGKNGKADGQMEGDVDEVRGDEAVVEMAARELDEYFEGRRKVFDVPVRMYGTPFQMRAWEMLRKIPYGETWSYSQQAEALGCPKAVRAVANSNRLNAISIIVPCHRVIGSNRKLTGYAGGLEAKQWLLEHEQNNINKTKHNCNGTE